MYYSRNVFVLVATVLLLFVLTPNVVNSKSLRAMQQMLNTERHQTFVDVNGGFVGTTKCVDGILYAQLLARNKNTPVEQLPKFIQEYCEEDIALALGVPEKDFKSSTSKIWREAFKKRSLNNNRNNSSSVGGGNPHVIVTAKNQMVSVPAELSLKLDMSSKLCMRLSAFYKPGRFANRKDALVYCKAVKKSLAGRFDDAMHSVPSSPKPLMALQDHNTPDALAAAKVKCKPGATNIECGMDADGTRIIVDPQRSQGSFKAQAKRIDINTKAAAQAEIALNQYTATVNRLEQLKSLRDKKKTRNVIVAKLELSTDMTGKAQKLMMAKLNAQNLLTVALVRSYRSIHMDDVKLFKLHAMGKERKVVDPRTQKSVSRMTYETSLTLNVPKGDRTLKALLINMQQTTDFAKRVNKQLLKLHNHFFPR